MTLESPKVTVNKSAQEVFDFLSKVENFEKLMPDNIGKFEMTGPDAFVFALSGMPEIRLKLKDQEAPKSIVLGADGGKIDFDLSGNIETAPNGEQSDVQLTFNGDFNPMMAMMIKGPISKFLETLVGNIAKHA